ncbi:MAG: adenylate/guanylate cyclase domain-containing protein [Actinomycetota bacterium]|nr:adenylate/guanylate cyclase domain-containing protein [Actinomycetota bacterium]
MAVTPTDPLLARYAECYAELGWSVMILDAEWRLQWASDEVREFVRVSEGTDVGYGRHIAEALLGEPWISAIAAESLETPLFADVAPYIVHDLQQRRRRVADVLPESMHQYFDAVEPKAPPHVLRARFLAVDPADPELPPFPAQCSMSQIYDSDGDFHGWLVIMFMDVSPNLMSLLSRGNEEMYERMARLVEPLPRQAAILFCDLSASGELSRQMSSISYFRLIRSLWTGIDDAVADEKGVIGKHAGDGASAYFLVDELESPSAAACAAIRTAQRIHDLSREIFRDTLDTECQMRVGLHWGGSLYMGQLVPRGRLDVSALGNEVNEGARIQEAAGPDETLVSKQLLEQLLPDDAAALGIDLEKVTYQPVAEIAPRVEKVMRDVGNLSVTTLGQV